MSDDPELAADALQALTDHVFSSIHAASGPFEDLVRTAIKYQSNMEQCVQAAEAFVDCLAKVSVIATSARGATAEVGQIFQKLVSRHKAYNASKFAQAQAFSEQFINPLQKRLKLETKNLGKKEDDFKALSKTYRAEMKKAGQNTVKAQQKATKSKPQGGATNRDVDEALENLVAKSRQYESFNQRCLRSALVEERRRYCYLVDNYISVFQEDLAKDQQLIQEVLASIADPETCPPASEQLVQQHTSQSSDDGDAGGKVAPSPLTREIQASFSKKSLVNDAVIPPGAPIGGIRADFIPREDQVNPRASARSVSPVASNSARPALRK